MSIDPSNSETDYWSEARAPLSSLLFLIPWIGVYELGVLLVGQDQPDAVRTGADFWMKVSEETRQCWCFNLFRNIKSVD